LLINEWPLPSFFLLSSFFSATDALGELLGTGVGVAVDETCGVGVTVAVPLAFIIIGTDGRLFEFMSTIPKIDKAITKIVNPAHNKVLVGTLAGTDTSTRENLLFSSALDVL
jgi:hypothetical protein